ncbi:MAG TPA: hypothetical protein DIW31_10985 [Bacteroidales bacterium]|nr:hypothetical protein [Bacteroidales bacterium]
MSNTTISKEEQLKEEAISAAQKLFQQYGFRKTTMEDIAKAMGRGKSTLYYYYKSKDEIFDEVITKEINEVTKKTKNAIEKESTAVDKLKVYLKVSLKTVKTKVNLYKIVKGELLDDFAPINKLVKRYNTNEYLVIKEILLLGIENNEFSSSFKEEIDLLAYSVLSSLRSLAIDMSIEEKFPNWEERLNILGDIMIKGLMK